MTQLSPFRLSEQWLSRNCGDRHWALISDALGQQRARFHDAFLCHVTGPDTADGATFE
ncbi:MAG: hypothetical protein AAGF94_01415 [Pseudomonadota bacterium]